MKAELGVGLPAKRGTIEQWFCIATLRACVSMHSKSMKHLSDIDSMQFMHVSVT